MKGNTQHKGTYSTRINDWSYKKSQQYMTRGNIIAIDSYFCDPNQRRSDCIQQNIKQMSFTNIQLRKGTQ